jgi:hypothetical protein
LTNGTATNKRQQFQNASKSNLVKAHGGGHESNFNVAKNSTRQLQNVTILCNIPRMQIEFHKITK